LKLDPDGDVHVKVSEKTWIFSPVCIEPVSDEKEAKEILGSTPAGDKQDGDDGSSSESELGESMNGKYKCLYLVNQN